MGQARNWQEVAERRLREFGDAFLRSAGFEKSEGKPPSPRRQLIPAETALLGTELVSATALQNRKADPCSHQQRTAVSTPKPTRKSKLLFLRGCDDSQAYQGHKTATEADSLGQLRAEVHSLGDTLVDIRKQRPAYSALHQLTAASKAPKGHRQNVKVGKGSFKRKQAAQAAAIEEALNAGFIKSKQVRRKRQQLKGSKGRRAGLNEDQGAFKDGLLRVRLPRGSAATRTKNS